MAKSKYYAVRKGLQIGVFKTWDECQAQVNGFKGAEYKSFPSREAAEQYLWGNSTQHSVEAGQSESTQGKLDVFVDGSFVKGQYSWAFAVYDKGEVIYSDAGVGASTAAANMRNVAGELAAAMRAAKWAQAHEKKIVIHHDYQGISSWVNGSWRAKNELTQQYKAFMQHYDKLVTFQKVTGHTGVEGNELADQLAREALGL